MIGQLIHFALAQRLLMLILVALLSGFGYYAMQQLPIDAFPDVSPTQVKIIIKSPGMTPEEVEARITQPVEVELLGIPKQTMLRSMAKYALTDITLDFEEGTDIYWARQQVAERLNAAWSNLPDGIEGGIAPMTTPLGEMFMFTIDSDELSLMERRGLLDWVIRPALRTVPGVADVNALGGMVRSFAVKPDATRMAARQVTLDQLVAALSRNNRNDGAGRLNESEEALLVRVEGRIKTVEDVRAIVVATIGDVPVRVGDIAEVDLDALTRYGAVSQNGRGETVEGLVLSLRGANARQTVQAIETKLAELRKTLPANVQLNVFYNRGDLVNQAVQTVSNALIGSIVLVVALLIVFLGNLRAALTVALVLPLAALFTFIVMRQLDMSANLMSLGGLAIAIGMLVDSAVVVVENVITHFSHHERARRLPRLHLIYRATKEVAEPVVSGTLIIIIVFLPLLTLQGLEGKLFTPVAITIVCALGGALWLSLTVIPVIASYLLRRVALQEPWLSRVFHRFYEPLLETCLAHPRWVFGIAGGLLVVTVVIFMQLGRTFMPSLDEGDLVMQLEKLPSITLQNSIELDLQVQRNILHAVPEVSQVVARVGADEIGLDPMGFHDTDVFLVLRPREAWRQPNKEALIEDIRRVIQQTPGIAYGFTQPIEMRVSEMLTGTRGDVAVKIFGPDLTELNHQALAISEVLKNIPGASDVFTSQNEGMQYLQLTIRHDKAGRLGLNSEQLQTLLRAQIEGLRLGIVQEGMRRTPLIVRGHSDSARLASLPIALPDGAWVPLGQVADIRRVDGVVAIKREKGQRFAVVRSNVEGRDLVGFVEEAKRAVAEHIKLAPGYSIEWGGQFENQQRASTRLTIVVPIALGLIFLLLFSTFGSIRQAVLILSNIPLAMIGGVLALRIAGEYLSVPASVGFIALLGIAVLNGVVLLSYFNQLRASGMAVEHVVVTGSMRRLRPVLMTASSTAIGLLPLLSATGPGSEIQRPLAIVVIGGLVSSTLLTLILLPILYRYHGEAPENHA